MKKKFKKIAIIRLGAYGDIIHSLPVLNRLRAACPDARITWVVDSRYQSILRGNREVSRLMVVNFKGWPKQGLGGAKHFLCFIKELRKTRFDLVLDLQGLIKSGVISYLTGAKTRVGFDRNYCREGLNALFNNLKVTPPTGNIIEINLSQLTSLGIDCCNWQSQIIPDPKSESSATGFWLQNSYDKKETVVGINLGGGWRSKTWPLERFTRLSKRILAETDWRIIIFWSPPEKEDASRCLSLTRKEVAVSLKERIKTAPPTDIMELAAFFKRLSLVVAVDTGPLHLAAALKIPTVALFGPTDPARNGPGGNRNITIHHQRDCSNCYKRDCPEPLCMESINVVEVFEACKQLMKENP